MMKRQILMAVVVALMCVAESCALGEVLYTVTDLGTFGGQQSVAFGINANGRVVGYSMTSDGSYHGFLYDGIMHDLGTVGGLACYPQAINDSGEIAGYLQYGSRRAFVYDHGAWIDPGRFPGGGDIMAYSINSSGAVVGYGTASDSSLHAFRYTNGTMTDLTLLSGGIVSRAYSINDSGQIAGVSADGRAILYSQGAVIDLNAGLGSWAFGINANGDVVGRAIYTGKGTHAFLYSNGSITDLGALGNTSQAKSINNKRQVVGYDYTDTQRAFLYSEGTMVDLNTLIDSHSGWQLQEALAINDLGWIAGCGYNEQHQYHAFLLTPIPEPSSFVLLSVASAGLLGYCWRRRRSLWRPTLVALAFALLPSGPLKADVFNMGPGLTSLETVPVGNPGNTSDQDYYGHGQFGAVDYGYQMGKYEVTNTQYCEFLNAKAATDTYGLYNTTMSSNACGGINRSGGSGSYAYAVKSGYENMPVTYVCWYDTLRFANWLQNGQGSGSTETGTYTITDGGFNSGTVEVPNAATRTSWTTAHWVLPSEDEWYKAAYHQPAAQGGDTDNYWLYPTRTNSEPYSDQPPGSGAPTQANTANYYRDDSQANGYNDGFAVTGSTNFIPTQNYLTDVGAYTLSDSFYGTFDQGGNVWEWNEANLVDLYGDRSLRGLRGSFWRFSSNFLAASSRFSSDATDESYYIGFRVASVPEPGSIALLVAAALGLLAYAWRRRKMAPMVLAPLVLAATAKADTFGTGATQFTIDFVNIGNPGNAADTTGSPNPCGKVDYAYRMGTYEISRDMITKANAAGSLGITLFDMSPYGGNGVNRPATGVSWNEAARFVNWLNTSKGFSPAYKFSVEPGAGGYSANANILLWQSGDAGYNAANPFRNDFAQYFLPSADEWYKAAYYAPSGSYFDYPTGSNTGPTQGDCIINHVPTSTC